MKWFQDSIPVAIQLSRRNKGILIVYITGVDDISKQMDESWEDNLVDKECNDGSIVGIKLEAKSQECVQFSEIYNVICVPSTYFIGLDGRPLDIMGGHVSPEALVEKIRSLKQQNLPKDTGEASATPTSTEDATASSSFSEPQASSSSQMDSSSTKEMEIEDKVKRANDLVEQIRLKKESEAKEEEKRKEKERIELGKNMQKLKTWKEAKEAEEIKAQFKKDKEEERKARERVREQIAKDRADRAAKYKKEKSEQEAAKQAAKEEKLRDQQKATEAANAQRSNNARIQFRLSDGSSFTQQFDADDTLETAVQYISQALNRSPSSIALSTTFPRRTFTEEDNSKTFRELNLSPSSVILVLMSSSRASTVSRSTSDTGFLAMLLLPFISIWTFLCSLFSRQRTSQQTYSSPRQSSPMPSTSTSGSSSAQKRKTPISRQEGRIHRLRSGEENDDDDTNTWNGNSTQQM